MHAICCSRYQEPSTTTDQHSPAPPTSTQVHKQAAHDLGTSSTPTRLRKAVAVPQTRRSCALKSSPRSGTRRARKAGAEP